MFVLTLSCLRRFLFSYHRSLFLWFNLSHPCQFLMRLASCASNSASFASVTFVLELAKDPDWAAGASDNCKRHYNKRSLINQEKHLPKIQTYSLILEGVIATSRQNILHCLPSKYSDWGAGLLITARDIIPTNHWYHLKEAKN